MSDTVLRHRPASPDDAPALAELVNYAGEGLPAYLWEQMARQSGETVWQVGERRARREEGSFSYRNALVSEAQEEGKVAACMIGYALPPEPKPIDYGATPAMFVPLQELENLATDSWYINVLATYPDYRGQGRGRAFIGKAEKIAEEAGIGMVSIIVSDANVGARRLYERCGYQEAATRSMVKEDWNNAGKNWVLLTKSI